ncbi:MAG TPA: hypothetical protein VK753_00985 [Xanthomonadaceae bacterium]|nr:hypothetical protein [Xanthomonadaceae bacterium]
MFELRRFTRLARAHWAESWRRYAWFLAAGVLLHGVISIVCFAEEDGFTAFDTHGQTGFYFTGLFVLTPIFASRYFLPMSNRASALLALMRPASTFEKWLLAALTVAVLYPLAYTLAFYLIDVPDQWLASAQARHQALHLAQEIARHPLRNGVDPFKPDYSLVAPWAMFGNWREAVGILLLLCSLQGIALFGSLYFRTVPLIKTVLSCLLLLLVCVLLSSAFHSRPDLVLGYWDRQRTLSSLQEILYPTLWLVFPGLFWLAGFLALKEREIAA